MKKAKSRLVLAELELFVINPELFPRRYNVKLRQLNKIVERHNRIVVDSFSTRDRMPYIRAAKALERVIDAELRTLNRKLPSVETAA